MPHNMDYETRDVQYLNFHTQSINLRNTYINMVDIEKKHLDFETVKHYDENFIFINYDIHIYFYVIIDQ